jgi:hypothetical protein
VPPSAAYAGAGAARSAAPSAADTAADTKERVLTAGFPHGNATAAPPRISGGRPRSFVRLL